MSTSDEQYAVTVTSDALPEHAVVAVVVGGVVVDRKLVEIPEELSRALADGRRAKAALDIWVDAQQAKLTKRFHAELEDAIQRAYLAFRASQVEPARPSDDEVKLRVDSAFAAWKAEQSA